MDSCWIFPHLCLFDGFVLGFSESIWGLGLSEQALHYLYDSLKVVLINWPWNTASYNHMHVQDIRVKLWMAGVL